MSMAFFVLLNPGVEMESNWSRLCNGTADQSLSDKNKYNKGNQI